jgi:hypothetical protein
LAIGGQTRTRQFPSDLSLAAFAFAGALQSWSSTEASQFILHSLAVLYGESKMADDTREKESSTPTAVASGTTPKKLPRGIILGKDGKP